MSGGSFLIRDVVHDDLARRIQEHRARHIAGQAACAVEFPDGSRVEATTHPARILLAGEARDVDILAGGWKPHMGLKLLQGYRISMRFVEGAAVSVERL